MTKMLDVSATLVFDGVDLHRPAHLPDCPRIAGSRLPARGVLGQAVWETLDPAGYERTRSETALRPE
ncbi:hypothetical protein ACFY0F_03430 [Streptomyces sp. NPDC001544]|uniref:hypothetical protein n=1 Tax=Streptomyces sp. NPDC001544 TaxID=3364584 RepID=UPI0036B5805A